MAVKVRKNQIQKANSNSKGLRALNFFAVVGVLAIGVRLKIHLVVNAKLNSNTIGISSIYVPKIAVELAYRIRIFYFLSQQKVKYPYPIRRPYHCSTFFRPERGLKW
jgi:hypothetical protein